MSVNSKWGFPPRSQVNGALLFPGGEGTRLGSVSSQPPPHLSAHCRIAGQEREMEKRRRGVAFRYPGHPFLVMLEERGGEEAGLRLGVQRGEEDGVAGPDLLHFQGKMRFYDPLQKHYPTVKATLHLKTCSVQPHVSLTAHRESSNCQKNLSNLFLPYCFMKMKRHATWWHLKQD